MPHVSLQRPQPLHYELRLAWYVNKVKRRMKATREDLVDTRKPPMKKHTHVSRCKSTGHVRLLDRVRTILPDMNKRTVTRVHVESRSVTAANFFVSKLGLCILL